jgi:hypothetical protein
MKIQRFNEYALVNEMKVYDILDNEYYIKQMAQCQNIPYKNSQRCDCGHSNFFNRRSYDIIGYCDTQNGFMAVFECLKCGEVYKHHLTFGSEKFDLDAFKEQLGVYFNLKSKIKKETTY